jgi:predicted nucleic acid-binding protein
VILIDSNVLIDILDDEAVWFDWSMGQLENAARIGPVAINHVVLAEVAPHQGDLAAFLKALEAMVIRIEPMTDSGAFVAGRAFLEYRKKRERPGSVIADFLIAGHAQSLGATILTRDPRFYRSYFPTVPLIAPSKDEND